MRFWSFWYYYLEALTSLNSIINLLILLSTHTSPPNSGKPFKRGNPFLKVALKQSIEFIYVLTIFYSSV